MILKLKLPGGCYYIYGDNSISFFVRKVKRNVGCILHALKKQVVEIENFSEEKILNDFRSILNTRVTGTFNFSSLTFILVFRLYTNKINHDLEKLKTYRSSIHVDDEYEASKQMICVLLYSLICNLVYRSITFSPVNMEYRQTSSIMCIKGHSGNGCPFTRQFLL